MRSSLAHSGASGRLMTSSSVLPMSRLASSVHTRSGWSVIRVGPGTMPYDNSAPQQDRRGRGDREAEREQRHEHPGGAGVVGRLGAGHPSMAPWPNSSAVPLRPASLRSVM